MNNEERFIRELINIKKITNKYLIDYLYEKELENANLEITEENIALIKPLIDEIINEYNESKVILKLYAAFTFVLSWDYNVKFENLLNHVLQNKPINKYYFSKMHEIESDL